MPARRCFTVDRARHRRFVGDRRGAGALFRARRPPPRAGRAPGRQAARAGEGLRDEHGTRVDVLPADLATGRGGRAGRELRRRRRAIDVLVNNAGVLKQGAFVKSSARASAGDRPQRLRPDRDAGRVRARDGQARPRTRAQRRVDRGVRARAGLGGLRGEQGLRAVADRVAGRGTARHRRHRHRALPGHYGDSDVRPRDAGQRARRAAAGHPGRRRARGRGGGLPRLHGGRGVTVPGVLNQAATVAGRATPKWLLRRVAGVLGRRML